MTVGNEDIFEPVIIEIVKPRSPAQVAPGIRRDPASEGIVDEMPFARIAMQRVMVIRKVCDENIQPSVVIQILKFDTHSRLLPSVLTESYSGGDPEIGEGAVAVIPVEVIGCRIIGNEQVRITVVVIITPDAA